MNLPRTNLRVVRTTAEGVLEVAFETGNCHSGPNVQTMRADNVKKTLAEMRGLEPWANWRLQTRGLISDWHDLQP